MGERIIFLTVSSKFLAPLPGTPVYKIGELHTIFYLFFLVLLVYLSVFTVVSLIKNTKIHVTLLVDSIFSMGVEPPKYGRMDMFHLDHLRSICARAKNPTYLVEGKSLDEHAHYTLITHNCRGSR